VKQALFNRGRSRALFLVLISIFLFDQINRAALPAYKISDTVQSVVCSEPFGPDVILRNNERWAMIPMPRLIPLQTTAFKATLAVRNDYFLKNSYQSIRSNNIIPLKLLI
jgi:hypothetical protein